MEIVILAGGLGTRLREVVSDVPKPMADINGKPFLEYILKYLSNFPVSKVVMSVGYKSDSIIKYFGSQFMDLNIEYSIEKTPLGTGGAIKKAIQMTSDKYIYVINGDTFFNIDLPSMFSKGASSSDIVLALKEMKSNDRYGFVETDSNGRVISFSTKLQGESGMINGGTYLVNRNIFDGFSLEGRFSFEDFLEKNYGQIVSTGVVFDDYFIDIGIPIDYDRAKLILIEKIYLIK